MNIHPEKHLYEDYYPPKIFLKTKRETQLLDQYKSNGLVLVTFVQDNYEFYIHFDVNIDNDQAYISTTQVGAHFKQIVVRIMKECFSESNKHYSVTFPAEPINYARSRMNQVVNFYVRHITTN